MERLPLIAGVVKTTVSYVFAAFVCLACVLLVQVAYEWATVGLQWTTIATMVVVTSLAATTLLLIKRLDARDNRRATTNYLSLSLRWSAFFASLVFGATLSTLGQEYIDTETTVTTDASQWQHIYLDDGSVAHLDARSRIKIDYATNARVVDVLKGNALFQVAKDPMRPFIVRTQLVDVAAVGTRFGVSIDGGVTTTVSEGAVKITGRGGFDRVPVTLRAGEELSVRDRSPVPSAVRPVDADLKLQWATGWLTFRELTVAEGIKEFNRRNRVQIVVDSPRLRSMVIGYARVRIDSPEDYASVIATEPGVAMIVDKGSGIIRLWE